MTAPPITAVSLHPQVDFPEDAGLPELANLFDGAWVWRVVAPSLGDPETPPQQIRVRQFSHSPGRAASVNYVAEWDPEAYIPPEVFTLRLDHGAAPEFFQYPVDRHLPGLEEAARPDNALKLVNRHIFVIPRRRLRVDMVRYRAGNRAVLRHRAGKVRLYVRVVRVEAVPNLLGAAELISHSRFVVPRVVGCWPEGGVVWLSEIPGKNVRERMRRGRPPDPGLLLDGLESLWALPPDLARDRRPLDLHGAYRRARRGFRHALRDDAAGRRLLADAVRGLGPFAESWRPSGVAHNDFYDDQMLALPDGRVALVDFEEAGPGDPMLDVGNFLAHLRWTASFGRKRRTDASTEYCDALRDASLRRFGWDQRALTLRESVCLFRICTNTIRRIESDWRERTVAGLTLVNEVLA